MTIRSALAAALGDLRGDRRRDGGCTQELLLSGDGQNPYPDAFYMVRGMEGWKEACFDINGITLHVAVVSGLRKCKEADPCNSKWRSAVRFCGSHGLSRRLRGRRRARSIHDGEELAEERVRTCISSTGRTITRFSHENPKILQIYEEFLEKPLSHMAHELLHTDHHGWKMPGEEKTE